MGCNCKRTKDTLDKYTGKYNAKLVTNGPANKLKNNFLKFIGKIFFIVMISILLPVLIFDAALTLIFTGELTITIPLVVTKLIRKIILKHG